MHLGRIAFIQLLAISLALLLVACPAQTPAAPDETPRTTTQETEEPEETAEETEEPEETAEETDGGDDLGDYASISHDQADMSVTVPQAWSDVETGNLWSFNDQFVGYSLTASPDIGRFLYEEFREPGVYFAASETLVGELMPEELLDEVDPILGVQRSTLRECEYDGREEYTDPAYTGFQDFYTDCGETDAEFWVIGAEAKDGSHVVLVQISALTDEDRDAYERILATFVAEDLPPPPDV